MLWFDGVVRTRGRAGRQMLCAASPLVSFDTTQGSRTDKLPPSITLSPPSLLTTYKESSFSGPVRPAGHWSVATPTRVLNLGVKSGVKTPWEGHY